MSLEGLAPLIVQLCTSALTSRSNEAIDSFLEWCAFVVSCKLVRDTSPGTHCSEPRCSRSLSSLHFSRNDYAKFLSSSFFKLKHEFAGLDQKHYPALCIRKKVCVRNAPCFCPPLPEFLPPLIAILKAPISHHPRSFSRV